MEKSIDFIPQKSSPLTMGQNGIHMRPGWPSMQAYYGSQFPPPPYLNSSAVASPHGHFPYLWVPPQSMIPPYGAPYAAFYAHGGFFGHTGVHVGGTAPSMDTPVKLVDIADGGFVKKLKEFDGLPMPIGNGNADNGTCETTARRLSESEEAERSSDGSTNGLAASSGKRSRPEGSSNSEGSGKGRKKCCTIPAAGDSWGSPKETSNPTNTSVKTEENAETALVPDSLSDLNEKPIPTNVPNPVVLPNEEWLQDEGDLKRERRKLSNRESARRSRLRKQAETEELTTKVRALTSENLTLKSEMNKLRANLVNLKLQNGKIMDKLIETMKEEAIELKPDGTQNLLERVNRNDSADSKDGISPVTSLRKLLASNHRTDAVAAG